MANTTTETLSIQETAELCGITKSAVYQAIREGRLPARYIKNKKRVRRDDAEMFNRERQGKG